MCKNFIKLKHLKKEIPEHPEHIVLNAHRLLCVLEAPVVTHCCLLQVKILCVSESEKEELPEQLKSGE